MSANSAIEWTDHTFNIAWGCTKISPGCVNCYADTLSHRYGFDVWGPDTARRVFGVKHWNEPMKWNREAGMLGRPAKVFCSSMCDLFEDHPTIDQERAKLWPLIRATPNLIWQLLTKRADRIAACLPGDWGAGYPNVWLGVSVESQEYADARIPRLCDVPAAVRFLSVEPMLGPVKLCSGCPGCPSDCGWAKGKRMPGLAGPSGISWVIVGGESGPKSRPMHPDWARSLRDQCVAACVAFHFKQWGEFVTEVQSPEDITLPGESVLAWASCDHGDCHHNKRDFYDEHETVYRVGKKAAGRLLDGRTWDEFPEVVA